MHQGLMGITLSVTHLQSCRRDLTVLMAVKVWLHSLQRSKQHKQQLQELKVKLLKRKHLHLNLTPRRSPQKARTQINLIRTKPNSPQVAMSRILPGGLVQMGRRFQSPLCSHLLSKTQSLWCERRSTLQKTRPLPLLFHLG